MADHSSFLMPKASVLRFKRRKHESSIRQCRKRRLPEKNMTMREERNGRARNQD